MGAFDSQREINAGSTTLARLNKQIKLKVEDLLRTKGRSIVKKRRCSFEAAADGRFCTAAGFCNRFPIELEASCESSAGRGARSLMLNG